MNSIEFRRSGSKDAALALLRTALSKKDLVVAFEAAGAVVAMLSLLLGKDEGVPASRLASDLLDHMFEQLGEQDASTVEELLRGLKASPP